MTAFYSFRIGFRVVAGTPCDEARELEGGHIHHAEPTNPHTGEPEDTDVGFPGPEHHIAEREWPMNAAMAVLGFGALFIGLIQVPGVDHVVTTFLDGHLRELACCTTIEPSTADAWVGLAVGGTISIIGIAIAYLCYVRRPGVTVRARGALRPLHGFLLNKWYFDELIDALVYRPTIAIGRFANSVFERVVVQGIVDGATGVVKGAGSVVRGAQSGLVRAYALLLVGGFAALGIYFLVVASLMLNVLLWTPLAAGVLALVVPRAASRWVAVLGAVVDARARDRARRRLRRRRDRAPARRRRMLDPRPRGPLPARASTGSASSWC